MSITSMIRWALLALFPLFIVSCGSLDGSTGERFHDASQANLVLIYYGPASVFMTKPDTREGGFLPLKTRTDVLQDIQRPEIGRNLAVVVVGYWGDINQTMQSWEADLGQRGFHRVVFLRSGGNTDGDIDGLMVLRDSVIASRDVQTGITVASVASAP